MKHSLKSLMGLIVVNFLILGCNPPITDKAKLEIKSTTQPNVEVKISRFIGLEQVTIVESKTDSSGHSALEVVLQEPMFALLQIGNKYAEVYLSPGDVLRIDEVGQDYKTPLHFSGRGAEVNTYVSWVNSHVESIKWDKGIGLRDLNDNEFFHRFDSLKTTILNFHKSYVDSTALPDAVVAKLELKNKVKFLQAALEYKFHRLNDAVNRKWEAHEQGKEYLGGVSVSRELEDVVDEFQIDSTLSTDSYFDYHVLLNMHWQIDVNLRVSEKLIAFKDSIHMAPLMTNALIKKGDYPETVREFLIAFDLQNWFAANGITHQTDSVFADFQASYPKSIYLTTLNKIYNEWLALAPGKPAPDFEGITADGKKVSIKDLKGKVVYMDVWATWCGPCVAEIPSSKKLQQQFAGEENIQFLNVSVGGNKTDWEKFLNNDNTWKGIHVNIDRDKIQAFYSAYKLFGVPDYILIDHAGNIVSMKAPRPSEEKVAGEIRKVLAK